MNISGNSIRALSCAVELSIKAGELNSALRTIHDFVERIVTEPLCTSQAFGSQELDRLCLHIGRSNYSVLIRREIDMLDLDSHKPCVVYIVSRLQKSGGHSRLMQDFIRAQPGKNHLIFSTEVAGPSDEDYFASVFASDDSIQFIAAPHSNFISKLTWLQSLLAGVNPEHVYLLNHHQDSVAVSALVPEFGIKGTFIHHGDHHLCLGVHMDHLVHVDLHPMGYHYCRDELGIDNSYLPLTFEDKNFVSSYSEFMRGGSLTTATAARSNKVEIPYHISYLDTITQILKVTRGRHVHIGKLTPWALRRIRAQMRENGISEDKLIYIEWTPSVWKTLQDHAADVYIVSFPYGAGLTLIEAMGAGIPVIMHKHMYSRVLSSLELAYPEAFSWAETDALLSHLATLMPERLEKERQIARQQYINFHRPEILVNYLRDPDSFKLQIPALSTEFRPRYDEWAAWAESQLNLYRLIYRFAYRAWRRLRSIYGS